MGSKGGGQARAQTQAGELQAVTAGNVGQRQSLTALEAQEMRAQAIEQASNIAASGFTGGGYSADSANAIIQGGAARASEFVQPYADVGNASLQALEQGATADGFAARLASIIDTDIYSSLRDERYDVADSRASAAGLNRSGAAIQEASDISTQTALGLDSELHNRQLTNVGIGQQGASALSNIALNSAGQQAGFTQSAIAASADSAGANNRGRTSALAQGVIGAADARATGLEDSAFYETSGVTGAANARANALVGSEDARAQARANRNANIMGVVQAGVAIAASPAGSAALFG